MKIYLSRPGAICCAGSNIETIYASCVSGDKSGIKLCTTIDGKNLYVGRVSNDISKITFEAIEEIKPDVQNVISQFGGKRVGLCLGTCDNGSADSLIAHNSYFKSDPNVFPQGYNIKFQSAQFLSENIAKRYGICGPVITVETACSSGAGAMIRGAQLLKAGLCDAVIAGGADAASEIVLSGFSSLGAVSKNITNPFSKNRDGITLGDAAAFFVMSRISMFENEVELAGYGESASASHMTAPPEDGSGAASAMKAALDNALIKSSNIDYINLHGTGTPLNDAMEGRAVEKIFGSEGSPAVSSTKPITGHTLGAAGALEAAICYGALLQGEAALPVHCYDGVHDENIPKLNFVKQGNKIKCSGTRLICMSNSFAFGGCNISLILARIKR
ncbi:MAG: beta-ketoacyl-[acyl-carrier-protein] synthase family protein [Termitinemataceae bacterium]|nr:MAG: beta-ketoacyl-[acyl-carrier-protein] synthase family protein [Termitinemataceae bacterium]